MLSRVDRFRPTRRFALAALIATAAFSLHPSTSAAQIDPRLETTGIGETLAQLPEAERSEAGGLEIDALTLEQVDDATESHATEASPDSEAPTALSGPGVEVSKGCGANYLPGEWIRAEVVAHNTGWHDISLSHAAGSASLGRHYLVDKGRYWLQFRINNPLGRYELQMTVPKVLILYRCEFTVGQPKPPAPAGKPSIDAAFTADDFLTARSCFGTGRRVYFVAMLKNPTSQPQSVAIVMSSRGAISSWWPHKIEALQLAPGQTRQVLAYDDQLPAREGYDYKVELFTSSPTGWDLIDTEIRSFKVGTCP